MFLIADFGNTLFKLAITDNNGIVALSSFKTLSPEEFQNFILPYPSIHAAILSSVVHTDPGLMKVFKNFPFFVELNAQTSLPITNKYLSPQSLGNDRLAAAVAAHAMFPSYPSLAINAGTCITFDLTDASGNYLGGSIHPGLHMRLQALHTLTEKLPLESLTASAPLTGNNTSSSIRSGVINGTVAEIKGIIQQYQEKYPDIKVIVSGGDMNYFERILKSNIFAVPNLVIRGLQTILEFHARQI